MALDFKAEVALGAVGYQVNQLAALKQEQVRIDLTYEMLKSFYDGFMEQYRRAEVSK